MLFFRFQVEHRVQVEHRPSHQCQLLRHVVESESVFYDLSEVSAKNMTEHPPAIRDVFSNPTSHLTPRLATNAPLTVESFALILDWDLSVFGDG